MLTDRSEAWLNILKFAPFQMRMPSSVFDGLAFRWPELRAFIGDDVFGLAVLPDGLVERFLEIFGMGHGFEDRKAHALPGEMIHDQKYPPTEWPALGEGEGEP